MSARNDPDLPFLISGGGIGGCAAALALARQGFRSIVLEQADDFGETGAGIQIGPNAFKMFARLGITEAIDDVAVRPSALVMRDGLTGDTVMELPVNTAEFSRHFDYPYAVIYRPDLHGALMDACRQAGLVELRSGAKVTAHADHGDRITADLATGETAKDSSSRPGREGSNHLSQVARGSSTPRRQLS